MTRLADRAAAISVVDIMAGNNAAFCRQVGVDLEVYWAFVEEDTILPFYSQFL
jgi:hypothetical protein